MEQTLLKCKQCGAELAFAAGTSSLACPYCGASNEIKGNGPVKTTDQVEILFDEYVNQYESQLGASGLEVKVVKCATCGGETTLAPSVTSGFCDFCGAQLTVPAKSWKVMKPQYVLPFKLTKEQSSQKLQAWLKGLWFAPVAFKRLAYASGQVKGIYFPFWTFDAQTSTWYRGERGDDHRVATGKDSKGNTQYKTVTNWTPKSGTINKNFDDLLVPGSDSLPEGLTDQLDQWNLNGLVEYDDAYIAGFHAESYTIDVRDASETARGKMEERIVEAINRDIGGDHQRIHEKRTTYQDVTFKHILLPIWFTIYNYKGKMYNVVINADSGEIEGERPWSILKITILILCILAVLAIGYLVSQ
jgi:DNA-directed RNA polymerase subunit RPC12/RpoP